MSPPEFLLAMAGIIAGGTFLLSPVMIVRTVLNHREKMAALRNRQEGAPGVVEEMAALRRDMAALRETTTRFDMSFDAALSRVEDRLGTLEQTESGQTAAYAVMGEETQTILRAR